MVVSAVLIMWATPAWYGASVPWRAVPTVTLLGFGLYQLNRISDEPEDSINNPEGAEHAMARAGLLHALALTSVLLAVGASFVTRPQWGGFLVGSLALAGWAYSRPVSGGRDRSSMRLKQHRWSKNSIPALVWTMATVIYPATVAASVSLPRVALVAIAVGVGVLTIEIAWDIRDAPGDLASGVATMANTVGARRALAAPFAIAALAATLVVSLVAARVLKAAWLWPAVVVPALPVVAYALRSRLASDRMWSQVLVVANLLALVTIGMLGREIAGI